MDAASIPATSNPRNPAGTICPSSRGIATALGWPGPKYARAATPQNMGMIARPANVIPVQKKTFFATAGLAEASAFDVPGCHSAPAATLLRNIQITNVHPKRGFAMGSKPASPREAVTASPRLARSRRSRMTTVATPRCPMCLLPI